MHTDIDELNQLFKSVSDRLNLSSHIVRGKVLHGPADIEGHQGTVMTTRYLAHPSL